MPLATADTARPLAHTVVAVLQDPRGRVLIQQRAAHWPFPGLYEYPGGSIEAGETPRDALGRELAEELGVRPVTAEPLAAVTLGHPHHVRLHPFLVTAWSGTPAPREGQSIAWGRVGDTDGKPRMDGQPHIDALLRRHRGRRQA